MTNVVKIKYGRAGQRLTTQKQQREARAIGTAHPRSLARSVARGYMKKQGMERLNKVPENRTKSIFSVRWRDVVSYITGR